MKVKNILNFEIYILVITKHFYNNKIIIIDLN